TTGGTPEPGQADVVVTMNSTTGGAPTTTTLSYGQAIDMSTGVVTSIASLPPATQAAIAVVIQTIQNITTTPTTKPTPPVTNPTQTQPVSDNTGGNQQPNP
ncbi:MAG: hypothetical protein WCS94_10375, partial [Verrucomicrobiota bacterium]